MRHDRTSTSDTAADGRPSAPSDGSRPEPIDARTLMGGLREVVILHGGERYRLRVTQNNKLILTK